MIKIRGKNNTESEVSEESESEKRKRARERGRDLPQHFYLVVLRVGLPVVELILGDGVLNGPQPAQHDAGIQLRLRLEAGRLGGHCSQTGVEERVGVGGRGQR